VQGGSASPLRFPASLGHAAAGGPWLVASGGFPAVHGAFAGRL